MGIDKIARRIRDAILSHHDIFVIPKEKGVCKYDDKIIIPAIINNYRIKCRMEIVVSRDLIKNEKYDISIGFKIAKDDISMLETLLIPIREKFIEKSEKYNGDICTIDAKLPSENEIYENFIDILAKFYRGENTKSSNDDILQTDKKGMVVTDSRNIQNTKSDIKKDGETSSFGYKYAEEFDKNKLSTKTEIRDIGIIERYERIVDVEKYIPDRNYQSLEDKVKDFRESLFSIGIQHGLQKVLQQEGRVNNMSNITSIPSLPHYKPEIRQLQSGNRETILSITEQPIQPTRKNKVLILSNVAAQCLNCKKIIRRGSSNCPHCGEDLDLS